MRIQLLWFLVFYAYIPSSDSRNFSHCFCFSMIVGGGGEKELEKWKFKMKNTRTRWQQQATVLRLDSLPEDV